MSWFEKAMKKFNRGVKKVEEVTEKIDDVVGTVDDAVEKVEEVKEVMETVTESAEELLQIRTNELSLANVLIERLRGEVLDRVAEVDAKIDKAMSPAYRLASESEFKDATKSSTKMPADKGPKGSEAVLINYYDKGFLRGVEIRWPQKRFYYLTSYTMPNLDTLKEELLDTIRV